jgi:cytochrome b6-f complex iron-sulfur subunit
MSDEQTFDLTQQPDGDGNSQESCSGRRRFLCQVAGAAGSLTLGLSTLRATVAEAQTTAAGKGNDDLVLKFNEHKDLSKVGGSEVITTDTGKVIVARTDETTFAACSAICTHRGGQLFYDHGSKQFVCPSHGARFDLSGKVAKGPAKNPLQAYTADSAVVVDVKPVA